MDDDLVVTKDYMGRQISFKKSDVCAVIEYFDMVLVSTRSLMRFEFKMSFDEVLKLVGWER